MNAVEFVLKQAGTFAVAREDRRAYTLGAIGIRSDGALVHACNGPTELPNPKAHAEARLCAKLDKGTEVYVTRLLRTGAWGNARPCADCMRVLRSRKVRVIYYTIQDGEYGVIRL